MSEKALLPLLLGSLLLSTASAITVTTSADGEPGSLRDVLGSASDGETITFDSSLSGQALTLTQGQLVIDENLTIDASALANGFTINADGQSRILEIQPLSTVVLQDLTLTGGMPTGEFPANSGGAIYNNQAELTLRNCTLSLIHI